MKHLIIGTAGHVDHGKTMLVEKITGTNTDRLKEEKDRGISIELGFAPLTLNNGQVASIIDVPGHERFIKNMLAGVGGIDIVILVVAADEGVMPQTREHLDIIQLLQIKKGIIVITKIDLVDKELLEIAEEDVRDYMSKTNFKNAPIIKVSSFTGQGLNQLKNKLTEMAETITPRPETGIPRLPIDRVFSVTGFGTVVTGTLVSGYFETGSNVELYPQGIIARIRSLQVHGHKQERAGAGQRVAINLVGVETSDVKRGDVVATPGELKPWNRIDVKLYLLKSALRPLKNRARVRVYLGTAEVLSRVIILDRNELKQGDKCYAQLHLETVIACARDDRFVIRSYSPMRTIGGGKVIDATARKHKRLSNEVIEHLKTKEKGSHIQLAEQYLEMQKKLLKIEQIKPLSGLGENEKEKILKELVSLNKVKKIEGEQPLYLSYTTYKNWIDAIINIISEYHSSYPLREGFPKEELRSRLFPHVTNKQFQQLLQAIELDNYIKVINQDIALPDFEPRPHQKENKIINKIEECYYKMLYNPSSWADVSSKLGLDVNNANEILQYLLRKNILFKVSDNLYFHREAIKKAKIIIGQYLEKNNQISVGETRDLLNTSRKFALPLLEYFDAKRITRRVGDLRVAGRLLRKPDEEV